MKWIRMFEKRDVGARVVPSLNAFKSEAGFEQSVADGGDVCGAAGFERHIDDGFAEADTVVGTVVDCFDNVGAFAGEDLGEMM